jgi:hypothetical protein
MVSIFSFNKARRANFGLFDASEKLKNATFQQRKKQFRIFIPSSSVIIGKVFSNCSRGD